MNHDRNCCSYTPCERIIDGRLCYWSTSTNRYIPYSVEELKHKLHTMEEREQIKLTAELIVAGYKLR